MEQNENIENNGFENFEDHRKYAAIDERIEKQADKYAKVAQRILVAEVIEICVGMLLPGMIFESSLKYVFIGMTGIVVLVCHLISLWYAVGGYRMKKTKKTRETIVLHKVIPVVCAVMIILFFVAVYSIWALLVGFMPERISFFDWLF